MSIRHAAPVILAIGLLLFASPAHAAGGGADAGSLALVVLLIAVVGFAYLMTHFLVDWLQRLFLVATSVEYLVLGVLLGIVLVPDHDTRDTVAWLQQDTFLGALPWPEPVSELTALAPLIALAAGWLGLIYGMSLDVRTLIQQQDGALRLALLEGLFVAVPVGLVGLVVLRTVLPPEDPNTASAEVLCAGVLGMTAWAGSTSAMDVVRRRYKLAGETLVSLVRGARFSDMLAILAFGVLFAVYHDLAAPEVAIEAPTARVPTPVEWSVITLGLGAALGALFAWFLDEDDSDNGTLLALVGIIAFASGAAYFLELSEITVNLVLGMVLVNVSRSGPKVRRTVQGTYRPMNLLLLLLAGALWDMPPLVLTIGLTLTLVFVRGLGKAAAGWTASFGTSLRRDVFRGLIGQGDVAIAMAVTFKLVYDLGVPAEFTDPAVTGAIDATYTAILVAVVLHEIIAPRILKGLLVDAGEIRREAGAGG